MDRRTVAKRLEDVPPYRVKGQTKYWRGADAFPALYAGKRAGADSQDEAERRKANAEADIAEMKAQQMRGDVVSITAFEPVVDRAVAAARAKLMAVPSKLASIVRPDDPGRARALLDTAMREVLEELRGMLDAEEPPELDGAA
jgi:hypothetical protein